MNTIRLERCKKPSVTRILPKVPGLDYSRSQTLYIVGALLLMSLLIPSFSIDFEGTQQSKPNNVNLPNNQQKLL